MKILLLIEVLCVSSLFANSFLDELRKQTNDQVSQVIALKKQTEENFEKLQRNRLTDTPFACQGRLTFESGVPVSTTDRIGNPNAGTIYFTPYKGARISLWTGTTWTLHTFTERSLALAGLAFPFNFDVFLYNNAGTLTLELTAWADDITRGTNVQRRDGVWVRAGAQTRRYLGTIRTVAANASEDSVSHRFLWNFYHRVYRHFSLNETTDTWTYGTATIRAVNNNANNYVDWVSGINEATISLRGVDFGAAGGTERTNVGTTFGNDAATVTEALALRGSASKNVITQQYWSEILEIPGLGYHSYFFNEVGVSTIPDENWYGDNGDGSGRLSAGVLGYFKG